MFADLKEYQDLTRIYNESVNISEEERELQKFIDEEDFTLEELEFCVENFEEISLRLLVNFTHFFLIFALLIQKKILSDPPPPKYQLTDILYTTAFHSTLP